MHAGQTQSMYWFSREGKTELLLDSRRSDLSARVLLLSAAPRAWQLRHCTWWLMIGQELCPCGNQSEDWQQPSSLDRDGKEIDAGMFHFLFICLTEVIWAIHLVQKQFPLIMKWLRHEMKGTFSLITHWNTLSFSPLGDLEFIALWGFMKLVLEQEFFLASSTAAFSVINDWSEQRRLNL